MRTLDELHPLTITLYFLAAAGLTMFCSHPALLVLSLVGAVGFCFAGGGAGRWQSHAASLVLLAVLTLVNPLTSHNGATVLVVINDLPVTLESLLYGLNAAVMILAVLYWLRSFTRIMTSEKLLCVFGSISPKLALIVSMTLRFIPLFAGQARRVREAQRAVGYYKSDNIIDRTREDLRVFDIVMTWALENGIITADSMAARSSGTGRRTHFSIHRFRRDDACLLLLTAVLAGITAAAIVRGALRIGFYPTIETAPRSVLGTAGLAAYGALVLLPSVLQGVVHLRWRWRQGHAVYER